MLRAMFWPDLHQMERLMTESSRRTLPTVAIGLGFASGMTFAAFLLIEVLLIVRAEAYIVAAFLAVPTILGLSALIASVRMVLSFRKK